MTRVERARKEIAFWQSKFRLLEGWSIEFDSTSEYKDQCSIGKKEATIYDSSERRLPREYIFHEITHIAWSVVRESRVYHLKRENEEVMVQDLCKIVFS